MNILETLSQEMKQKKWSLETKKRFLYLRSCQFFTYDIRYYFLTNPNLIKDINNAFQLKTSIEQYVVDLENFKDPRIICFTWSDAFKRLMEELLSVSPEIITEENGNDLHAFLFSGCKMDATEDNDLTRVKMQLCTYGYEFSRKKKAFVYDVNTPKKLKKIDKKIAYITKEYTNIHAFAEKLKLAYRQSHLSDYETFRWWMDRLQETFLSFREKLLYFDDASYAISYLFLCFFKNNLPLYIYYTTLFDDAMDTWEFLNIYRIEFANEIFYYALLPTWQGYLFTEIPYSDVLQYTEYYKGENKQLLLKK